MIGDIREGSIELVVHTHDDRGYLKELLENLYIIKKSTGAVVILSYNGSSDEYYSLLSLQGLSFEFIIRRIDECDVTSHLRNSVQACNTKYINLLHDDDILDPNIYSDFIKTLIGSSSYKSFSCNDFMIVEGIVKSNKLRGKKLRKLTRFELCVAYLLGRHAICFPSIIYDTAFLRKVDILKLSKLGKYSDVNITYFLTGAGHGWYPDPGFGYRIHKKQDSKKTTKHKILLYFWLVWKIIINLGSLKFSSIKFLQNRILFKGN